MKLKMILIIGLVLTMGLVFNSQAMAKNAYMKFRAIYSSPSGNIPYGNLFNRELKVRICFDGGVGNGFAACKNVTSPREDISWKIFPRKIKNHEPCLLTIWVYRHGKLVQKRTVSFKFRRMTRGNMGTWIYDRNGDKLYEKR